MMNLIRAAAVAACVLTGTAAHAQGLHAVQPLQGYACMNLNLSPAAMQNFANLPPVLAAPSPQAPKIGVASALVIARSPEHVVNGYAEVLHLNGQAGWVAADKLAPYHSASDPNAHCTPSLMSNGRPGFGP